MPSPPRCCAVEKKRALAVSVTFGESRARRRSNQDKTIEEDAIVDQYCPSCSCSCGFRCTDGMPSIPNAAKPWFLSIAVLACARPLHTTEGETHSLRVCLLAAIRMRLGFYHLLFAEKQAIVRHARPEPRYAHPGNVMHVLASPCR